MSDQKWSYRQRLLFILLALVVIWGSIGFAFVKTGAWSQIQHGVQRLL